MPAIQWFGLGVRGPTIAGLRFLLVAIGSLFSGLPVWGDYGVNEITVWRFAVSATGTNEQGLAYADVSYDFGTMDEYGGLTFRPGNTISSRGLDHPGDNFAYRRALALDGRLIAPAYGPGQQEALLALGFDVLEEVTFTYQSGESTLTSRVVVPQAVGRAPTVIGYEVELDDEGPREGRAVVGAPFARARFKAVVSGTSPITSEPFYGDTSLGSARQVLTELRPDPIRLVGAATTVIPTEPSLLGEYTLVLSNSYGEARASFQVEAVEGDFSPVITQQPAAAFAEGGVVYVSVETPDAAEPVAYQWYREGVRLPGERESSLVRFAQPGSYQVRVSNVHGSTWSEAIVLPETISGKLLLDFDLDGVPDVPETGLGQVAVFVDLDGDGVWTVEDEPFFAATDSLGRFYFQPEAVYSAGTGIWQWSIPPAGQYLLNVPGYFGEFLTGPASARISPPASEGASVGVSLPSSGVVLTVALDPPLGCTEEELEFFDELHQGGISTWSYGDILFTDPPTPSETAPPGRLLPAGLSFGFNADVFTQADLELIGAKPSLGGTFLPIWVARTIEWNGAGTDETSFSVTLDRSLFSHGNLALDDRVGQGVARISSLELIYPLDEGERSLSSFVLEYRFQLSIELERRDGQAELDPVWEAPCRLVVGFPAIPGKRIFGAELVDGRVPAADLVGSWGLILLEDVGEEIRFRERGASGEGSETVPPTALVAALNEMFREAAAPAFASYQVPGGYQTDRTVIGWTTQSVSVMAHALQAVHPSYFDGACDPLRSELWQAADLAYLNEDVAFRFFQGLTLQLPALAREQGLGFEQWLREFFDPSGFVLETLESDWGYRADPDGDGIPNILEYALGGNPLVRDPLLAPEIQSGGAGDELRFRVIPGRGAVRLRVSFANALGGPFETVPLPAPDGDGYIRVPFPSGQGQVFGRIEAQFPPFVD